MRPAPSPRLAASNTRDSITRSIIEFISMTVAVTLSHNIGFKCFHCTFLLAILWYLLAVTVNVEKRCRRRYLSRIETEVNEKILLRS